MQRRAFILGSIGIIGAVLPAGTAEGAAPGNSDKLPPGFAALLPPGYPKVSQRLTNYGSMGNVWFSASKQIPRRHSVTESEYRLDVNIAEAPQMMIKQMYEPSYRAQLEKDVKDKLADSKPTPATALVRRDAAVLKRYPWGAGITQKVVHKYIGAGSGPDETEFVCAYFGVLVSDTTVSTFKLNVFGVESAGEADSWAGKVAAKVGSTTMRNLGK